MAAAAAIECAEEARVFISIITLFNFRIGWMRDYSDYKPIVWPLLALCLVYVAWQMQDRSDDDDRAQRQ